MVKCTISFLLDKMIRSFTAFEKKNNGQNVPFLTAWGHTMPKKITKRREYLLCYFNYIVLIFLTQI